GEQAESWCRVYNDCVNEFLKKYPEHFTAMAAVPMQEPARAARVLQDAVTKLGFRGAYIATNVNHRYYDSEEFDPFWAKAEELGVLVFMHPDNPAGTEVMGAFGLRLVCGNPADTTLSLGMLIYGGVLDRFPNLKLCTCHGGGFLPYHLSRFDREFVTGQQAIRRAGRPGAPKCVSVPSAYLKNLYFDTLVYDVETLEFLRRKVGAEHLMLGTDFPYILGDWQGAEKVEALACSAAEKHAILEGNARKLLNLPAR
ncbi:MAG TPA: amidohydrolase family protein, partial [Candidatus Binatia bacterium]|nr:amidohydrolase family protein [Candidatus Binatia bacterium]